jgi:hypothetical protein
LRAAPPADWPHRSAHTAPLAPAPLCARCSRLRRLRACVASSRCHRVGGCHRLLAPGAASYLRLRRRRRTRSGWVGISCRVSGRGHWLVEDISVFVSLGHTQVDTNGAHPSGASGMQVGCPVDASGKGTAL